MKVSVCMITYNHEDYIVEAIESVLSQVTSFSFELIIGEDKSTDGTWKICNGYAEKYPGKIKLISSPGNVGMMKNFMRTLENCTGEYIAYIEGDDYWTDPLKLQKQIDFLEGNRIYSACFHNVVLKNERSNAKREWIMHEKDFVRDTFETADVLGPWFIASPSFIFVNYRDMIIPGWFLNCKYGDLPFMLLLSLRGKFKYLNEVMAVYRLHETGVTTLHMGYDKITVMVYIYESFNIHTNFKYQQQIREAIIYEIDRHLPDNNVNSNRKKKKKDPLFKRGFQRIKGIIRR